MKFKPMLGTNGPEDKSLLEYPVLTSYKLDGIRAVFHHELGLVTRSLKPIKNVKLNEKFADLLAYVKKHKLILDGEFYKHDLTFQEITSLVMRENTEGENPLEYHIFDTITYGMEYEAFIARATNSSRCADLPNGEHVRNVYQFFMNSPEDIETMFESALEEGYEGLIVRNPEGRYKFGRSTLKEQLLLKYKPFKTFDATIVGVNERFENTNESFKNEVGNSAKRNTVDAKKGLGLAATFTVALWDKGTESRVLRVTITGTEEFRRDIWDNREDYIGKVVEFKGMEVGAKDVPRHPVFLRFRGDK